MSILQKSTLLKTHHKGELKMEEKIKLLEEKIKKLEERIKDLESYHLDWIENIVTQIYENNKDKLNLN